VAAKMKKGSSIESVNSGSEKQQRMKSNMKTRK